MSNVTIQLLDKVAVNKPNAAKDYKQMVVTHRDLATGKVDGKKIFDFATPKDVWETLVNAQPLQCFTVTREKDKTGKYWEWKGISATTAEAATPAASTTQTPASAPTASNPARVGNWETPDERAARQIYIVRQSNITAAIEYLHKFGDDLPEVSVDDVLRVARQFENHVFGQGVAGLTSDMPE